MSQWIKDLPGARLEAQLWIINALGHSESSRAGEALLSLFDVRKGSPRQSAAIVGALGLLKEEKAVEPLITAWDYLDSLRLRAELPGQLQTLRAAIIEALGRIKDKRAEPLVLRALSDEDGLVVQRAAEAAGRLSVRKAFEPLVELLARGGDIAQSAYEALGEMKDERADAALTRGLKGEDLFVRASAAYALARLGKKAGEDTLRKIMRDQAKETSAGVLAAYYMVKLDDSAGFDYLFVVLKMKESPLRAKAALALGKAGNLRAVLPLIECLKDSEDADLRLLAARGLGQLGGTRAVLALNRAKDDRDSAVRAAARMALNDLGEMD